MATKDCNICGKPIDSHKLKDMTDCIAEAGYIDYTGGDDAGALALAQELGLLVSIGQPHQDKNVYQIRFTGSKNPVETINIAETVYRKCLTKIKQKNPVDEVYGTGSATEKEPPLKVPIAGPFSAKSKPKED